MKTRLLLFVFLMVAGVLNAQDTIKTLIITEFRGDDSRENYVEITNVGETTLNLGDFQIGTVSPWSGPIEQGNLRKAWHLIGDSPWPFTIVKRLPAQDLAPGKSFVIAEVFDWNPWAYALDVPGTSPVMTKKEFWTLADIQAHYPEDPKQAKKNSPTDSVNIWHRLLDMWGGTYGIYIAQYLSPTDSVVVDLVNAYEMEAGGTRDKVPHDVAGVTNATRTCTLIRKASVKSGNLDFLKAAGLDYTDSEWIPIPHLRGGWEMYRALFWTAGNHGSYNLDQTTLTSNTIDIDWTNNVLTVPWGVRRDDSIMFQFDHKPGLAWHFDYAKTSEDSAYYSLRTGDVLTVYACGDDVDIVKFDIVVSPPTADENRVVPKKMPNSLGYFYLDPPSWVVTDKIPGMDTIMRIPFALRSDTLLKYLEKVPDANWELEWLGGTARTDVQTGDMLKVTAKNGAVKKYFIKTLKPQKSHNAQLASITWPDIPEFYKGLYGWVGDTIPGFSSGKTEYVIQMPMDATGIPAMVAKPRSMEAKVVVDRAKNLNGSVADKTATFLVTAQDDTTLLAYHVRIEKEKDPNNIQPWLGKPFISQFVWKNDYANTFIEIVNPGTEPLDLSNYMVVSGYAGNPADAIRQAAGAGDFAERYRKYIPGYKWAPEADWATKPGIALPDNNIDPMVQPGDVFAIGQTNRTASSGGFPDFILPQLDIDLGNNPWGEILPQWSSLENWFGKYYFFEILNDSVKAGTKPATDPNDFELLDCFADNNGQWIVGGIPTGQTFGFSRKPEISRGNPVIGGSFGTTEEDSEWIMINEARLDALGYPWPDRRSHTCEGIGAHFMKPYTLYQSTITSGLYKVSPGYSENEEIIGLAPSTTVEDFLPHIVKAFDSQTLTVINAAGDTLTGTDVIADNDQLFVVSADGESTTVYTLVEGGLSHDAVLTSTKYKITTTGETGTITGFYYGTAIRSLVDKVTVPDGASLAIINNLGNYVPLSTLNFDTLMVDVEVNKFVFFEVTAEDNYTKIVYQVLPNNMNQGAFVTSDVYFVSQEASLIDLIPQGTGVYGLMKFLVPAPGANMKLVDKLGFERKAGNVMRDDRVVVTSESGQTTKIYYLMQLNQKTSYLAYVLSDVYAVNQLTFSISGNFDNINTTVDEVLSNLIPAEFADMKVINSDGVENTGTLALGDLLLVTAGNNITHATYSFVVKNNYEAFVLSDVYVVSQLNHLISGADINNLTTLGSFASNLIVAPFATIKVTNEAGVEKTSGNLEPGDKLIVTAGDNATIVTYNIDVQSGVGVANLNSRSIQVFPNPSTGMIYVAGLQSGNRVYVSNLLGQRMIDKVVHQKTEMIDLTGQSSGIYFVTVNNGEKVVGRYKLVLK